MFFYVYVLECFVLVELYKLVVKAVWKLAYRQILVAFCASSKASKALKGFCLFFSNFIATVLFLNHFFTKIYRIYLHMSKKSSTFAPAKVL